jgi:hypothetical protein
MRQLKPTLPRHPGLLTSSIVRLTIGLAVLWWAGQSLMQPALVSPLLAQEERNPTVGPDANDSAAAPSSALSSRGGKPVIKHRTFIDSIKAGGYIGVIIILMSVVAVAFVIEHSITIRKERLMPESAMENLEDLLARGDIQGATQYCEDPRNYSLATDVILAGLFRPANSALQTTNRPSKKPVKTTRPGSIVKPTASTSSV